MPIQIVNNLSTQIDNIADRIKNSCSVDIFSSDYDPTQPATLSINLADFISGLKYGYACAEINDNYQPEKLRGKMLLGTTIPGLGDVIMDGMIERDNANNIILKDVSIQLPAELADKLSSFLSFSSVGRVMISQRLLSKFGLDAVLKPDVIKLLPYEKVGQSEYKIDKSNKSNTNKININNCIDINGGKLCYFPKY